MGYINRQQIVERMSEGAVLYRTRQFPFDPRYKLALQKAGEKRATVWDVSEGAVVALVEEGMLAPEMHDEFGDHVTYHFLREAYATAVREEQGEAFPAAGP